MRSWTRTFTQSPDGLLHSNGAECCAIGACCPPGSPQQSAALAKVTMPARAGREVQPKRSFEVTANDRRFLRSLRIAADETAEPVE